MIYILSKQAYQVYAAQGLTRAQIARYITRAHNLRSQVTAIKIAD